MDIVIVAQRLSQLMIAKIWRIKFCTDHMLVWMIIKQNANCQLNKFCKSTFM